MNLLAFLEKSKIKIRIGADSFYTRGKTLIYKNYFTTGLYNSLNVYSGQGVAIYLITSFSFLKNYKITLGVNEVFKNNKKSYGSGYDEIIAFKVNSFELSFNYNY